MYNSAALIQSRRMLVLFPFFVSLASPAIAAADARVGESYGKLPLHFEANRGQTHKDVLFLSRDPGFRLYLTGNEAVLVLTRTDPDAKRDGRSTSVRLDAPARRKSVAIRMSLVGAPPAPLVSGLEELPGKANYFLGKDPAQWRTNVPTYAKVHYREVYPGIDLVYYGNQRQLEYDFVVAPEADPKKIVLGFKGTNKLEIDAQGNLLLHVPGGAIRQHKPVIYQEIDGVRQEIAGSYIRKGANRVGFKVAAYDRSRPLVIDPVVLSYSTYLGGSGFDSGYGIAVDASGNAYVTGETSSANFPTTTGAFQTLQSDPGDAFVTKFDPTGSTLVYSTFLGGRNHQDVGVSIAVDDAGSAYLTGFTESTDFPTTPGAIQPAFSGGIGDAFVAKLNPNGSALVYSTYLGGSDFESGVGIAIDGDGNAYAMGQTYSVNFPTTPGAFQTLPGGDRDTFVTKINPTGSGLIYSTYLSGSGLDFGGGIAVDANGNVYVTGGTTSFDFPTTPGAFQTSLVSAGGGFVSKLDPAGSALVYSTYLGNGWPTGGSGIAVDAAGNAYVTGSTNSTNFPTTVGAFQPVFRGGVDAFVTKLNPTGSALVYSTYLGGSRDDQGSGIAVDVNGYAYVTGKTGPDPFFACPEDIPNSIQPRCLNDFPTSLGPQPIYGGGTHDAFVTKLDPTGSLLIYSTYLGGIKTDSGNAIAVDTHDNAYVIGQTFSSNFPTTAGAFQPSFGGGGDGIMSDAFVAKIVNVVPPPLPPLP